MIKVSLFETHCMCDFKGFLFS